MDPHEPADRMDSALAAEPTDNTEAREPAEPIDRIEPADPIDRMDPAEPIDRIDPADPMLRIDPAEPPGGRARRMTRMMVDRMPAFWPVTLASGPAGPAGQPGPVCLARSVGAARGRLE